MGKAKELADKKSKELEYQRVFGKSLAENLADKKIKKEVLDDSSDNEDTVSIDKQKSKDSSEKSEKVKSKSAENSDSDNSKEPIDKEATKTKDTFETDKAGS